MSSKAITEKPEPEAPPSVSRMGREFAPSVMAADEPTAARWLGGFGLMFLLVGVAAFTFRSVGWSTRIGPTVENLLIIVGVIGMLFHAAWDGDLQIRRAYAFLGFLCLAAAVCATLFWQPVVTAHLLRWGTPFYVLALLFLLAYVRHEDDPAWRQATLAAFGVIGAAAALAGLIGGTISSSFLLSNGLPLAILGLAYLWAFIATWDGSHEVSLRVGVVMAVAGLLVFAVALVRWLLPTLFKSVVTSWGWTAPDQFLASVGLLQMMLGFVYVAVAFGLCSENRFVVLTRRELAAFFYSPMVYFVLFLSWLMATVQFGIFLFTIRSAVRDMGGRPEPIIIGMVWGLLPILSLILIVPLLTMRLFSEEQRTGTMEMLLTAPVKDGSVLMSKFVASLIVFLLSWLPYGLFMIALRVEGGQPYDYRPILSFAIAVLCSGAAFMAMGLFFSSLTRNQLVAGILAALGMLVWMAVFMLEEAVGQGNAWFNLLTYVSFLDLWRTSLFGKLALKDVAFQISAAVVWLFLTLKVLESRRWR